MIFHNYAKSLDSIVKTAFKEYENAETEYRIAEKALQEMPERARADSQYLSARLLAQDKYQKARDNLFRAKSKFSSLPMIEIKKLRNQLENEIQEEFSAKPEQIDQNTLELLKSGILEPREYSRLLENSNLTMRRIIGQYAREKADEIMKTNGQNDPKAAELLSVEYQSRQNEGTQFLNNYDALTNVFARCINNPAMIRQWDTLVSPLMEDEDGTETDSAGTEE